jgi:hypothetical protein
MIQAEESQGTSYPFFWIQVKILHLAVLEEARQSDAIVSYVRLLTNHDNVVFSSLRIELQEFLTSQSPSQLDGQI